VAEQRWAIRIAIQINLAILRTGRPDAAALRMLVSERYAAVLKSMHHRKEASALLAEVNSFHQK
jgi:hypothetical protein